MKALVRCPHCGQYHNSELTHCPQKGLPIYTQSTKKETFPKKWLWGGIGLAVLILSGCIIGSLWFVPRLMDNTQKGGQAIPLVPTLTLPPFATRIAVNSPVAETPVETPVEVPSPSETPATQFWQACAEAGYLSQLHIGDEAMVSSDPPLANRVRENASTNDTILGYIDPGEHVEVLEGPTCNQGWVWWKVRSLSSGLTGWTAEGNEDSYWLIPAQ